MIGHDKDGKPYAVLKMNLTVETDEEGVYQAGVAEWFRADTGEPITDANMKEIEELLSTRLTLAKARCVDLGIVDEDLRKIVLDIGRHERATGDQDEGYNAVINVSEAAAAEQRRRDVAHAATPVEAPTPEPTSEEMLARIPTAPR